MANKFASSLATERQYARDLRKIAIHVAGIVSAYVNGTEIQDVEGMNRMLAQYSEALTPWANRAAEKVLRAVSLRNQKAFNSQSKVISTNMRLDNSVAMIVPQLQNQQVKLIKSLPTEAGERAQKLAYEAALDGTRSAQIAEMLANTEGVTKSRATLIARTEVAKANAMITQARSQAAGIDYYRWQTAEDGDVRESHAEMDGEIFRFDQPPTLSDGMTGNPGEFPNCFEGSVELDGFPSLDKIYRRHYDGKLSTLVFDDGTSITCTENHPIAGIDGFAVANSFNVGDYVVGESDNRLSTINDDIKSFNITFQKMFDSLYVLPIFVRSSSIGGEFHGDVSNSEVDIISIDWVLVDEIYSLAKEKLLKLSLSDSDVTIVSEFLIGGRSLSEFFRRSDSSFASFMSRVELIFSLAFAHLTPLEFFCLASSPENDLRREKILSDNTRANSEGSSNFADAFSIIVHGSDFIRRKIDSSLSIGFFPSDGSVYANSSEVFADSIRIVSDGFGNFNQRSPFFNKTRRIVDISQADFSGHVYNLQTVSGYYTVKSVHCGNCRCFAIPITPTEE